MGTKKQKPKEKERNRRTEKGKRGGSHRSQWGFPQNGTKMKRNKSKKWWREQGVKARFVFIIEIYKGGGGATTTTSSTSFFIMIGWTSWSLHPSWFVCRLVGLLWGRTDHAPPRKDTITRAQKEKKKRGRNQKNRTNQSIEKEVFFLKKKRRYLRTSSRRLWVGRWFVCLFLRVCVCVCVCWRSTGHWNRLEGGFFHELDRIVSIESTRVAVFGTSEQRGHDRETQEASTNSLNANDNKKWGRKKRKKKERQRHSRPKKKTTKTRSEFEFPDWLVDWLVVLLGTIGFWLVGWLVFLFSFLRILRLVASGWCDTTRRHTTQGPKRRNKQSTTNEEKERKKVSPPKKRVEKQKKYQHGNGNGTQ